LCVSLSVSLSMCVSQCVFVSLSVCESLSDRPFTELLFDLRKGEVQRFFSFVFYCHDSRLLAECGPGFHPSGQGFSLKFANTV